MLYFSYGSNMSSKRLRQRVPALKVGLAMLFEHELRFHKISNKDDSAKCDAHFTGKEKHVVYGVFYEIADSHKTVLDEFEGVGFGYETKLVEVHYEKTVLSAFTYFATHINANLKPFYWYKQHVLIGARENLLPPKYIEKIESIPDSDSVRNNMELDIYR